jgi:VanZ family protein
MLATSPRLRSLVIWLWYWLPPLLLMAFIFQLSSQPTLPQAPGPWLDAILKKLSHAFVYTLLFVLLFRAWRQSLTRSSALGAALLITAAYAVSDELHQSLVPGRHANWYDVLIDLALPTVGFGLGRNRLYGDFFGRKH